MCYYLLVMKLDDSEDKRIECHSLVCGTPTMYLINTNN